MIVWLSEKSDLVPEGLTLGQLSIGADGSASDCVEEGCLARVATRDEARELPAGALALVPAGQGANIPLLENLAADGREVYLTVNGLGPKSFDAAMQALSGIRVTLCFEDASSDDFGFFRQLAWLKARGCPVAVSTTDPARALAVAAMQFDALVCLSGVPDLGRMGLLVLAREKAAVRPMGVDEVEALAGAEASLSVSRPMVAGERLAASDLAVVTAEVRGLMPSLASVLAGKTLGYGIAPGEPLTFGHVKGDM